MTMTMKTMMNRYFMTGLLLAGLLSTPVRAAAGESELPETISSAQRAAVEVLVDGQLKGAGAFVSEDGLLITAAHLFKQPDARFAVITATDKRLDAELVAYDKGHDLALLRVPSVAGKGQVFLPVAKAIPPVGSPIFNMGNALRVRDTVMFGRVSQSKATFTELADSNGYVENFLVASMTPSLTSGGVWVDGQGRIVGVQNGRLNDGKIASGLGVVTTPQAIGKLMATRKTASTPGMGAWVWEVWTTDKDYMASIPEGTEGLAVTWLRKGGALEKAGLKRLDAILACDGTPVRRRDDLLRVIRAHVPGDTLRFTVLEQHHKETKEVPVVLDSLEAFWLESARKKKAEEKAKKEAKARKKSKENGKNKSS